ncbi:hypothetical protein ACFVT1_40665 [Streptomyces sp. NPDC057963]|uniref:hypothetical protein n=1 Tax=Streptomyces sp. NPDC057963 TaxID=3346290 RepID=UPI0036E986BD
MLLRRRVYGADHDHPGPRPDRRYAELVGNPLDGLLLLDITGWTQDEVDTDCAFSTQPGQFGAGGQAMYNPRPGDPARFDLTGDAP